MPPPQSEATTEEMMEYDSTDLGTGKLKFASVAASDGGTYSLGYQCGNCGEQFTHTEQMGTEAPKKLPCAKCGCCSATKAWQKKEPRVVVKETVINPLPQIVPVMIPSPPPHQPYHPTPYKPYEIWCGTVTSDAKAHFGVN